MACIATGGAAFPRPIGHNGLGNHEEHVHNGDQQGMSLRDYFAGQALPAVIEAYIAANGNGCAADHALRNVPALAYKYADAMLKAREASS